MNHIARAFSRTKEGNTALYFINNGRKRGKIVATYKVKGQTRSRGKMPPLTEYFLRWMSARHIPRKLQYIVRRAIASHDIPGRAVTETTRRIVSPKVIRIYARATKDFTNWLEGK
jgi:hypothetical protein